MGYEMFAGYLKMNTDFIAKSDDVTLSYELHDASLTELKLSYSLESIAGDGTDLSKTLNLLHWVSQNIYHDGCSRPSPEPMNAILLLKHAFQKGADFGINCRAQAIILTECLLSLGIFY